MMSMAKRAGHVGRALKVMLSSSKSMKYFENSP
jgi:hypothetical protein